MIPWICAAVSMSVWLPLFPMLFPRAHPRYVAPSLVADIPNVTYHGGLL